MRKKNDTVVFTLNNNTKMKMIEYYQDKLRPKTPPYAVFQAEEAGTVITLYTSNKVMFQGENAKEDALLWQEFNKGNDVISEIMNEGKEEGYKNKEDSNCITLPSDITSIGSDEVGTGDYFGPIVVTASYVKKEDIPYLESLGIRDSKKMLDEHILKIVPKIKDKVKHCTIILNNSDYNKVYSSDMNMNKIKAILHNKALYSLVKDNVDYDYIVELLGLEYTASTGSEVYIDKIEHIDAVKTQLKKMYGDNVEIYDNTSNYLDSECKVVGLMGKTSKIICWMIIIMGEIILLIVFSFYTIQYQKDTGLFMVLGRSRKWCIGRFAFIGMIYAISGLLLGVLLYCVLGNFICSIISGIGKNVIINSTDRAIGGYDTPGIFQGFEVRIEMSAFFTLKNIIILLIISLVNWITFMVLPVVTTVEENAKKLLNSKG